MFKNKLRKAEAEVTYFDRLHQQLQSASPKDIEEIREELQEEGYIKKKQKKGMKKPANQKPLLEQYYSSDGTQIFVGKNNKQNDYLTLKLQHGIMSGFIQKIFLDHMSSFTIANPDEETIQRQQHFLLTSVKREDLPQFRSTLPSPPCEKAEWFETWICYLR